MEHKGTRHLETERLVLRPLTLEDAPSMYKNWASDKEVTTYLTWQAHPDVETSEKILREWTKQYENPSYYQWAIVLKEDSQLIGTIGVNNQIDETVKMAHIGYCIGKRWWHMGLTSEALQGVMTYLFDQVGVNRIESRHDPRNVHSGDVMRKCAMKYEGTHRQADWNNQGVCDACYYALLASERLC